MDQSPGQWHQWIKDVRMPLSCDATAESWRYRGPRRLNKWVDPKGARSPEDLATILLQENTSVPTEISYPSSLVEGKRGRRRPPAFSWLDDRWHQIDNRPRLSITEDTRAAADLTEYGGSLFHEPPACTCYVTPAWEREVPHKVKTQYVQFRLHANYFLLPSKILEDIIRWSMLFSN